MADAGLDSLSAIEAALWRELAAAAHDVQHGWRRLVLATRAADAADARTLVLRELDADQRLLLFYTDARSAKVLQIAHRPAGTLVGWCAALSWQVRMRARLDVQTEGLAVSSRWARLALTPSAQDYLAPAAPGTPVDAGSVPPPGGRTHFALLSARIESIDWLELGEHAHRRASFDAAGARWLVP
ncbi:MAG: pyridoxamine 5'-phosphate oxidase family protein [Burkholderiales bacterium]|nr:pyridoxamine 5'-phosphate oxidase family protein [Burkholderiales bacterium]